MVIDREKFRPGFERWYPAAHPKSINPLLRYRHHHQRYIKVQVETAFVAWCAALEYAVCDEDVRKQVVLSISEDYINHERAKNVQQ